mmetsp:Transcript_41392/g.63097  ORF Transcript_41392/g.63097 Transcript_41392/m.63097 type:complete len:81 (-) Transcript_41392:1295-1537(-)
MEDEEELSSEGYHHDTLDDRQWKYMQQQTGKHSLNEKNPLGALEEVAAISDLPTKEGNSKSINAEKTASVDIMASPSKGQ